jgi:hypothetical protein
MSKRHWLVAQLTTLLITLTPNLLSDYLSPLIDPGNMDEMRVYLIITLTILYFLFLLLKDYIQSREPVNPENPAFEGWFEAIATTSTLASWILLYCFSLHNPNFNPALWLLPLAQTLANFHTSWPTHMQKEYRRIESWIWDRLHIYRKLSIEDVLIEFARTPAVINSRQPITETIKGKQMLTYIRYFAVRNHDFGVFAENDNLFWNPIEQH